MAKILKGAPVAERLNAESRKEAERLKKIGIMPTLAILRVGERADDLSYERSAEKRCAECGVAVKKLSLSEDTDSSAFFSALNELNRDSSVHGILMFRPLPKHIDEDMARKALRPEKDVDGCTDASLAGVFTGTGLGFPPCTAQAVVEILDFYGIPCEGRRAVVLGRSLVVGKPAAMLLLQRNATVTLCHSKSEAPSAVAREADILVVCTGKTEAVGSEYFSPGQSVIDVGIAWNDEKGKLCGDVKFEEAEAAVSAVTPVPGGVGAVTVSVLIKHVVEAAGRAENAPERQ